MNEEVGGGSSAENLGPVVPSCQEEVGEYYFESDALALKENKDYKLLIKTLVKLEAQKIQCIRNLETLKEAKEGAVKDPLGFVRAIQNGEDLGLPNPIQIVEVPEIDWDKYQVQSFVDGMRPTTRRKLKDSSKQNAEAVENEQLPVVSTTNSYNPWTAEEQRKLEELLIKYPDEKVASRRWEKISRELGTRTPLQVQSRIQKYFITLKRKGLPIPGKDPSTLLTRLPPRKRRSRQSTAGGRDKSMFIQAFDFGENPSDSSDSNYNHQEADEQPSLHISDEEDVCESLRDSEEYQEMLRLKKVKRLKIEEEQNGVVTHYGFQCDNCKVSPIEGTRWHCTECPPSVETNLCSLCFKSNVDAKQHLSSHSLRPIRSLSIAETLKAFQNP